MNTSDHPLHCRHCGNTDLYPIPPVVYYTLSQVIELLPFMWGKGKKRVYNALFNHKHKFDTPRYVLMPTTRGYGNHRERLLSAHDMKVLLDLLTIPDRSKQRRKTIER